MSTSEATDKNGTGTANANTQKLKEACGLVGEAATDFINSSKEQAEIKLGNNKQQLEDMSEKAESFVKEKPVLSIGCAFVAGWIFSKIL